jgi:O-antigen/teichoic acid export membrane protein
MMQSDVSEKKKRALTNITWAISGKIVSLTNFLVVSIIVARYLGKEQYGMMNYVVSFVAIFQVFADFGLDFIQIREESRTPDLRDKIIGTTFALKLFFAVLTFVGILVAVLLLEKNANIRCYIIVYALSVILNTTWVARNHFTSIVWNEYVVKAEISRTLIGLTIKVIFVLLRLPLIWFIIPLVIDSLLLAIGYTSSYTRKIDSMRKWHFDRVMASYMLHQSFPLLLSGAAIVVYNRIDQLMIGNMIDQSHLGIYSVAVRFTELLIFVPTIIAQTISPILIEMRRDDEAQYDILSCTFINVTVSVCILLALATCLLSYPIVYFTFGQTYISAASVLAVMAFKVIGDALSQTSGQLIIIEGRQKYVFIRNTIGCLACIVLNMLLIPRYGIIGAAYVAVITIIVSGTFSNFLIPQYRKIFYKQMKAISIGWMDVINAKKLFR